MYVCTCTYAVFVWFHFENIRLFTNILIIRTSTYIQASIPLLAPLRSVLWPWMMGVSNNYRQEMGLYGKIQALATGDVKHGGEDAFSMKTAGGLLAEE